jgi:hypothetical protein
MELQEPICQDPFVEENVLELGLDYDGGLTQFPI